MENIKIIILPLVHASMNNNKIILNDNIIILHDPYGLVVERLGKGGGKFLNLSMMM
jgi:hypothetical protein